MVTTTHSDPFADVNSIHVPPQFVTLMQDGWNGDIDSMSYAIQSTGNLTLANPDDGPEAYRRLFERLNVEISRDVRACEASADADMIAHTQIMRDFQQWLGELLEGQPSIPRVNGVPVDEFTYGYLECALWADPPREQVEEDGEMFDEEITDLHVYDFAPETLREAVEDCNQFRDKCAQAGLWNAALVIAVEQSQIGHDLWLTRRGHGVGFWDGDYDCEADPDLGDKLTKIAKSLGHPGEYLWIAKKGDRVAAEDIGRVFIE